VVSRSLFTGLEDRDRMEKVYVGIILFYGYHKHILAKTSKRRGQKRDILNAFLYNRE
jgi:hypothetical protein